MLEIDPTLPAELGPLQWLIGEWAGTGVVSFPIDGERREQEFGQRMRFSHDGLAVLTVTATSWLLDDDLTPLAAETGYWRLARPTTDADAGPGMLVGVGDAPYSTAEQVESLRRQEGGFEIEADIVHSTGVFELYLGTVDGPRIDLATDAVVRSPDAKEHTASTRMLGLVDGHLLWAWDLAALGQPIESHASARLARVERTPGAQS